MKPIRRGFWVDGEESISSPTQLNRNSLLLIYTTKLTEIETENVPILELYSIHWRLVTISILAWQKLPIIQSQNHGRQPYTHSGNSLHTAYRNQDRQKGPCPANIRDMGPDHWSLLLISERQRYFWPLLMHLPTLLQVSRPPQVTSMLLKNPALLFIPSLFSFSPFGSQTLKTRTFRSNCIYRGNLEVSMYAHRTAEAQKTPEKTLILYCRLILGTETAYNNIK